MTLFASIILPNKPGIDSFTRQDQPKLSFQHLTWVKGYSLHATCTVLYKHLPEYKKCHSIIT